MSLETGAFLLALLAQTSALVWWGATITATVKQHDEQLRDHEERLREGKL